MTSHFRHSRTLAGILVLLLVSPAMGPVSAASARAQKGAAKAAAPRGAELLTAAQMRDYLSFIASNELEGRDTPSRGLDTAARFLATQLARFGLEPGGDEGYFQRMTMTRRRDRCGGLASHAEGSDVHLWRGFPRQHAGQSEAVPSSTSATATS